jgi:hypothetical protein
MRSESKARFRRPRSVEAVSAPSNFLPSSAVSQFPTRTPSRLTPFTRRMPAARSGLRSPQSDASYASRRIAANLRLIVDGAYGCCSSAIRYRVTTVLLKASLGSEQYQSMNSRMAWSYERFELEDVRLFKTADFDCSRSGNLRTVFGTRLRFLFAIVSGLRCRSEKHDPVPDLLTGSAFPSTDLAKLPTSRLLDRVAKIPVCPSSNHNRGLDPAESRSQSWPQRFLPVSFHTLFCYKLLLLSVPRFRRA